MITKLRLSKISAKTKSLQMLTKFKVKKKKRKVPQSDAN